MPGVHAGATDAGSPFTWVSLSFPRPLPWEELAVLHALGRLGVRGFEEDRGRIQALLPTRGDPAALVRQAEGLLRILAPASLPTLAWRVLDAHEEVGPLGPVREVQVSQRIALGPPPEEAAPALPRDDIRILMEPGIAFGDGSHGTTRGCLRLLEQRMARGAPIGGGRVLDLGAGTGVLAVAAVRLGAADVMAVERDPLACEQIRRLVELNEVAGRVHVDEREVRAGDIEGLGVFFGIMANLEGDILLPLFPGLVQAMAEGGWLVASGASRGERGSVVRTAFEAGLQLEGEELDDGWWSGLFARSRSAGLSSGPSPGRSAGTA